jgi:putative transposase
MAHPKRMPGFDYHGRHRVIISACTWNRTPLFDDATAADEVASQLFLTSRATEVEVTVYCVMRDHVHALLTGLTERAHVPTSVGRWKQLTGYRYKQRTGRPLWQGNYWDRVLRAEDETLEHVRYVIRNPLTAGFKDLRTYRWLGSDCWNRDDLLEIAYSKEAPFWWRT